MTSKTLNEQEEKDELKKDGKALREYNKKARKNYMEEINKTFDKQIDEIHVKFLEYYNINDIKELNLIKDFVNFYKSFI